MPKTTTAPDRTAEIADALINLVRLHASIKSRVANAADPDLASMFVLVRLVKDGPHRAKDVADQMCADQSTVSRQVATLVKTGLVERQADPDDGRASILVATELGIERVQEHFAQRGQAIAPVVADWTAADRDSFLGLVRRYTADLEARREEVVAAMSGALLDRASPLRPPGRHSVPNQSTPHESIERSN